MQNLSNWLMKLKPSSQKAYSRTIENFGEFLKENYGLDINSLKALYREAKYTSEVEKEKFLDKMHDIVEAYAATIKMRKLSSMHEALTLSIIRSYLVKGCGMKDVEVALPRRVFVEYHNRDLTREDIKQILALALPRDKAFFLMMAESGMRPDTLVQLRYKHIKHDYEKGIIPMKIELPSLILKDNPQPRFTFIGEDAVNALKTYLGNRKLEDDELLFKPIRPGRTRGKQFGTEAFSNAFGRIVLKLGMVKRAASKNEAKPRELRLYGLRKYFNNNMKVDRAYIEFWMGHTDTKSHYISTDPEEHRKRYAEGYEFLRIYEPITDAAKTIQTLQKQIDQLTKEKNTEIQLMKQQIEQLTLYMDHLQSVLLRHGITPLSEKKED